MADPFSIAASALQAADVGLKLYQSLHTSIKDFKDAEKSMKRVANEVKTTSWALQQLGTLLAQDEAVLRTKPSAIGEACFALTHCNEAFAEVESLLPVTGRSIATRLKWVTIRPKIDTVLANFERLKTSFMLVFKVISYAKEVSNGPSSQVSDQTDLRFQLETLVKAKSEAVRRYEDLLRSLTQFHVQDGSSNPFGSSKNLTEPKRVELPRKELAETCHMNTHGTKRSHHATIGDSFRGDQQWTDDWLQTLHYCQSSTDRLANSVSGAIAVCGTNQAYNAMDIWGSCAQMKSAVRTLAKAQPPRLASDFVDEEPAAPIVAAAKKRKGRSPPTRNNQSKATDHASSDKEPDNTMSPPPTNADQVPPIEPPFELQPPLQQGMAANRTILIPSYTPAYTQRQVSAWTSGAPSSLQPSLQRNQQEEQQSHVGRRNLLAPQHPDQYRALPVPPPSYAPPYFPSDPQGKLLPLSPPVGDKLLPDLPRTYASQNVSGGLSLVGGFFSTEENDGTSFDVVDELLIKWTTLPVS